MRLMNQKGFAPLIALGVAGVVFAGGTGAVVASGNDVPGNVLYPVKQATESVKVAAAFGDESKARAHLDIADTKLNEVEQLVADQAPADKIDDALSQMEEARQKAQEKMEAARENGKDVEELQALFAENLERQQAVLAGVLEQVPEQAQGAIQRAIESSQRGLQEAGGAVENRGPANGDAGGRPEGQPGAAGDQNRPDNQGAQDGQGGANAPADAGQRGR